MLWNDDVWREREAFEGKMTYVMIIQKGNPSAKHVFPSKKGTRTGWLGKELKRCVRPYTCGMLMAGRPSTAAAIHLERGMEYDPLCSTSVVHISL